MINENIFNPELAMGMINAHEIQFGTKPDFVVLPIPQFVFAGVIVKFHSHTGFFTTDKINCLHHSMEYKKEEALG